METFKYEGFTFKPLREFSRYETLSFVLQRIRPTGICNHTHTQNKLADWDYEKFYSEAIASDPVCEIVDVFVWVDKKVLVVPCDNELFEYRG